MNSKTVEYTNIRNTSYMFNIYNEGINKGESYKRLLEKEYIGINISYQEGERIKEEQEKYKYIYMLDLDIKEIKKKIGDEDKVLKEYEEAIKKINEEGEFRPLLSEEEDAENCYRSDLELAEEKGIKQSAINIARKMLKNNEPIEKIIQYSNLTKEEIDILC